MARRPCTVWCVREAEIIAAGRKRSYSARAANGKNGGQFRTEGETLPRVEGAGSEKREMPTERMVPELCSFFAEIALQLVGRSRSKEVKDIIRPAFDASFDPGDLGKHVKGIDDCNQIDTGYEKLAAKSFTEKVLKIGIGSSLSKAVLYQKKVSAVLRRLMAMSLSQNGF